MNKILRGITIVALCIIAYELYGIKEYNYNQYRVLSNIDNNIAHMSYYIDNLDLNYYLSNIEYYGDAILKNTQK